MPAVAILVVLLLGAGVGVGAEQALPGDTLYPIKVEVNENVRSAFTLSEENKTAWAERRAERRLEEAEALADRGELTTELAAALEARFDEHAEDVRERLTRFEEKENFEAAADLSSKFESSLAAHARVLVSLRGESQSTDGVDRVVARVQHEYGVVSGLRIHAEGEADEHADANGPSETSIRARLEALANHVDDLRAKITREGAELSTEARAELTAKINAIESASGNAKAKLEANLTSESSTLIRQAERMVVEARLFLEAEKNLNLNFGEHESSNSPSSNSTNSHAETDINTRMETGDDEVHDETEKPNTVNLNLGH